MWEESEWCRCVRVRACMCFHVCVCVQKAICQLGAPSYEEKTCIFMKVGGRIGHGLLKAKCREGLDKGQL